MRFVPQRRFRGRFSLPGDKSLSHRLAILGALAEGETRLHRFSTAADCASTLECLGRLGVKVDRQGSDVRIHGSGPESLRPPSQVLDCGNSGSTIRMLAGALASRPFVSTLSGDASLLRRPVERVAAPLRAMGAQVETSEGHPPLVLRGGPLQGIDVRLDVPSAQVKTAVLLAGLQAKGATRVSEPAPSRDHTERLLPAFGAKVAYKEGAWIVRGGARLHGLEWSVPGDVSSAAFLVVAALVLPDAEVQIDDVLLNPRRTAFLSVLEGMGASVETKVLEREPEPRGSIRAASSRLSGFTVPKEMVPSLIDEVPALAVAACHARGEFVLEGAEELRVKESDRIAALCEGLRRMGAEVEERPDGLRIRGGRPLSGAEVRSFGDHRIAMALVMAALSAGGETEIDDTACVGISFPEFFSLVAEATA